MTEDISGRKSKLILGGLALVGVLLPGPQRLYLGQRNWGIGFVIVGLFILIPVPFLQFLSFLLRLICLVEGLWVLTQSNEDFDYRFNRSHQKLEWTAASQRESDLPEYHLQKALREGIITQAEFKQQQKKARDSTYPGDET